jgi:OOP family OmpA-OmpF porin
MRSLAKGALGLAALLLPLTFTPALADAPPMEVGLIGGLLFPDDELNGHGPDADDQGYPLGLQVQYRLIGSLAAFADGHYASIGSARPSGDVSLTTLRGGLRLLLPHADDRIQFFFNAGVGYLNASPDNEDSVGRPLLSAGFGQRFLIGERISAHWEARADGSQGDTDADFLDGSIVNRQFLFGVSLGLGGGEAPQDSDRDGVNDDRDACPNTPRGAKVDRTGCPLDGDADGVWDGLDECPETPAGLRVDGRGCSDADGDGVADDRDNCPDTPAGWPVDAHGCPTDADGDGVADGADKCPDTPRGAEVDADGCPKAARLFVPDEKGEVKALVLEGVTFENNSAQLTSGSRAILDDVAASLVAWPDVNVEVGGHTDSRGDDAYNQELSQKRADSVKAYLTAKGVDAARLTTKGYGETKPVADNDTADGRARNRRVELTKTK